MVKIVAVVIGQVNKGGYKWGERSVINVCKCGKSFKSFKSSKRKYCCKSCASKYQKRSSYWLGKKMPVSMRNNLSKAHKKMWDEGKMDNRKKLLGDLNPSKRPEVRKKLSISNSGEKHWNWQGGITKRTYPKIFFTKLRDLIKERDNYICQECGYKGIKGDNKLITHHIDWNKKNSELNNLITLCRSCHAFEHNGKKK